MLKRALLASSVVLALSSCQSMPTSKADDKPTSAEADQFVTELNDKVRKGYAEQASAQWLSVIRWVLRARAC